MSAAPCETRRTTLKCALCLLLVLTASTASLRAQAPARTFEELRTRLTLMEGESIEVIEDSGTSYRARLAGITERALLITTNGVRRDLAESQVREIRYRRPDKLWNGMLIGLGAGVAAALVAISGECGSNDSECSAITAAAFVPLFAGIGLGAGAAIDVAIRRQETVYQRPAGGTSQSGISPILARRAAGVRVSLNF